MNHIITLGLGLVALAFALIDFSTPTAQLIWHACVSLVGIAAASVVLRTRYAHSRTIATVEMLLFVVAAVVAIGMVVDAGVRWGWHAF